MNKYQEIFSTKKAIVIDGLSLIYRAYFATWSQLATYSKNNWVPTNAVRMMIIMVSSLLKLKQYDYGLVAFDLSRKSFRTELFTDYKSNRKTMEPDLVNQLPIIQKALELLGFKIIALDNFEADDIIGSFAQFCNQEKINVDIFTSDRDLLQLVNQFTTVNILKKGVSDIKIYNYQNFATMNDGINPDQMIYVKALAGDSSDNYKGVSNIGPKTAIKLIKEHHNIEQLFDNLNQLPTKLQTTLINHKNQIELFLKLATILKDVTIPKQLEYYLLKPDQTEAVDHFLKQYHLINLKKFF
ncbi:5'-3' exonuclease [[Mycoplasma] cavipharyngis]|uniref:5'-3' exonuclease n=1 Tax=[Mycoplasma] cavipharyngis TaxID=92757 RepID=UPI0037036D7C